VPVLFTSTYPHSGSPDAGTGQPRAHSVVGTGSIRSNMPSVS